MKKTRKKPTEREMIEFLYGEVKKLKAENKRLMKRLREIEDGAVMYSWDYRPIGAPHGW